MANQFIQRRDGQNPPDMRLFTDPINYIQSEIEDKIAANEEILTLSDEALSILSTLAGFYVSEGFQETLQNEIDDLKDILDYFSYEKADINFSRAVGAWFLPEAIESFCGEETGNESGLSIDGNNVSFWQHNDAHKHEIVYRLRSYSKKVEKVRFRRQTNARSELENLDIYVAESIGGLNNPENLAVSGASVTTPSDWHEVDFTTKQQGKYIKLLFDSANTSNEARIREFEAWVAVKNID